MKNKKHIKSFNEATEKIKEIEKVNISQRYIGRRSGDTDEVYIDRYDKLLDLMSLISLKNEKSFEIISEIFRLGLCDKIFYQEVDNLHKEFVK
jgi:hypothetical protein